MHDNNNSQKEQARQTEKKKKNKEQKKTETKTLSDTKRPALLNGLTARSIMCAYSDSAILSYLCCFGHYTDKFGRKKLQTDQVNYITISIAAARYSKAWDED